MSDASVEHARAFFESLGLDMEDDPELAETPERFTELLRELFSGVDEPAPEISAFETEFAAGDESHADPVILEALPFYSMCIHHMVPFFGTIDVAYIPERLMTGFGSVGRVIDHFAARPQVQERLTHQIADHLAESLEPRGILVRCRTRQLCMEMRGSEKTGELTSLATRGDLRDGSARRDVLALFSDRTSQS